MADLLTEVCSDVAVEPVLAPITGEVFLSASTNTANDARADVRARGFWTRAQNAFFDVRVFHPDAVSYKSKPVSDLLKQHERCKESEYAERINNVDRGSFTPLVFTTAGRCAPECTTFIKGALREFFRWCVLFMLIWPPRNGESRKLDPKSRYMKPGRAKFVSSFDGFDDVTCD